MLRYTSNISDLETETSSTSLDSSPIVNRNIYFKEELDRLIRASFIKGVLYSSIFWLGLIVIVGVLFHFYLRYML